MSLPRLRARRVDHGETSATHGGWRPLAGFTWEPFCIGVLWVQAYAMIPVVLLPMIRGAQMDILLWTAFTVDFAVTFKLTGWLSDRYRARQRGTATSAHDLLSRDPRPPVLYLRPFKDDETTSRMVDLACEEQELAEVVRELGPFVAFGEPGEDSPNPGAARMYVKQDGWQPEVEGLMSRARLIVARIGNTDGFWWEISRAVELVGPERLLLLVPDDSDVYEEFRRKARGVFPCPLPDHEFRPAHFRSLEGILYFEPDWTPRLLRFEKFLLRQNYWATGVPFFKAALRPIYERFGVEWKRPPVQPAQLFAISGLFLCGALAVYVAILQLAQLPPLLRALFEFLR